MNIEYRINQRVSVAQFIELLADSNLGKRRPVEDEAWMQGILNNSNLIVSAWHQEKLVGISRCITDMYDTCYLSDFAVSTRYQKKGIDKKLQALTKTQLGSRCKLIIHNADENDTQHLRFQNSSQSWVLNPD